MYYLIVNSMFDWFTRVVMKYSDRVVWVRNCGLNITCGRMMKAYLGLFEMKVHCKVEAY